jgi:O-antigen ligase
MSRLIFWALVGTVILSPVPLGAIHPQAYSLLAVIVALLVGLWSVDRLISGDPPAVSISMIRIPALLFGVAMGWICIQAISWSPGSWHNPAWPQTADLLSADIAGAISVNPYATETVLMRLLAYAGIFWLALQYGRSATRAKQVFYAISFAGLIYAGYGLIVEFTGSESFLWFTKEYYKDNVTSTFHYKNAYATYAGLGLIATSVLLVRALGRESYAAMGPRERFQIVLTLIFERIWYLFIAMAAIFAALLLSDSRGGFLAAILALVVLALVFRRTSRRRIPYGRIYLTALGIAGVLFIYLGGGTTLDRLGGQGEVTRDARVIMYTTTLKAIERNPVKGWGAGSFESVYAFIQGPEFSSRLLRAHNEYLDNALGMGIPATIALAGSIFSVGVICLRGTRRRRRDAYYPAAGVAAVVLVGTHSAVDFTMQTPAVAATFALLAGTCCAQAWSSLADSNADAKSYREPLPARRDTADPKQDPLG